jgi:hypothetical protein
MLFTYPLCLAVFHLGPPALIWLRDIAGLSAVVAGWAMIRALSTRIPQLGKPYYSDYGTLSALMIDKPHDLSIPWAQVATIIIEFLAFAALWVFVIGHTPR